MITIIRTDSNHPDFIQLVGKLDRLLGEVDGGEHAFYAQFNKIDKLSHVVVANYDGIPAGCGAFKPFEEDTVEIKRMFVEDNFRKKGIASRIVTELEDWAGSEGYSRAVLETGKRLPEAVALYRKQGYQPIPNYGQYVGVDNSVCMEKHL